MDKQQTIKGLISERASTVLMTRQPLDVVLRGSCTFRLEMVKDISALS